VTTDTYKSERFKHWTVNALIERAALEVVHQGSPTAGGPFARELEYRLGLGLGHDRVRAEVRNLRAERVAETGEDFAPWSLY
jgi:hypothetical protein